MRKIVVLAAVLLWGAHAGQARKLLVISIDGLDARYLHQADQLGLKIPHLRRMMAEGTLAAGVVGIVPTVTWPSHTTIVTGVPAEQHGIPTNDQPGKPGQRWWSTSFLKAQTLWQAALAKNLKTATIYWPVTLGAPVHFNFPEFWETRSGHEILFAPILRVATPGLAERVARAFPSFPRSRWTDDSAMQAVRYLLEFENPDLILVHIADLDSEQHEMGAFTAPAKATLEHQDELLAWALSRAPAETVVVIVSDHGFENVDYVVRPQAMLKEAGVRGKVEIREGLIGALDDQSAAFFRSRIGRSGIARQVGLEEVRKFAPGLAHWRAAFDTQPGHVASAGEDGPALSEGTHRGTHGLWPTRRAYRASFLAWGQGVRRGRLNEISMLEIAPTLAEILQVELPAAKAPSLWPKIRK